MIIIQYLVKETLKRQVAILFILILIFFSQKTINILSSAVHGNIPSDLIFPLLWFGIPEIAQLILPLSLFLALLMSYSKFYIDSEITIMYACGLGRRILVIAALILALFTTLIAVVNVAWVLPWSAKSQEQTLADAKANPSLASMIEGQFKTIKDQYLVLYITNVKNK
ncbi:MAG: LptF/LptG family permease, partial [Arsenophonus sp. NC-QC1-MAG3]